MNKRILVSLLLLVMAAPVFAGGPLILFDESTQTPYAYAPGTVDVYTDLGNMGPLSNAQADILTGNGFAEWSGLATSYFNAAIARLAITHSARNTEMVRTCPNESCTRPAAAADAPAVTAMIAAIRISSLSRKPSRSPMSPRP